MLHVVSVEAESIAEKDWLWVERPDGEVYLLTRAGAPVKLPGYVASALALRYTQPVADVLCEEVCPEASQPSMAG